MNDNCRKNVTVEKVQWVVVKSKPGFLKVS